MDLNKPWGQVGYEAFVGVHVEEFQALLPKWHEMSDSAQARWEEHARQLTLPVAEKFFPGDEKTQEKAFDMGQGNLDLTEHLFTD